MSLDIENSLIDWKHFTLAVAFIKGFQTCGEEN